MPPVEAAQIAAEEQSRTILLTGLAAILGVAPMVFCRGVGAELRASCAIPVIGGILASMLSGLYLTPALCALFPGRGAAKNDLP